LNRIDASGGPPLALADASHGRGGTWGPDGTILFTPDMYTTLFRVAASGGTPQPVTKLNSSLQETTHRWPQFLPDGKHFLFYVFSNISQVSGTYAASLDGGEPKLLVRGHSSAVYAPPGYLLFIRQGTLMAQRFYAGSLRLTGEAMPLAERVDVNAIWQGIFTVSQNGVLAYDVGSGPINTQLLWYDRSGKQIGETGTPGDYEEVSLSPGGSNLAVTAAEPVTQNDDIWVYDLARGIKTRLTFSADINVAPFWSPDGKAVAFMSSRGGSYHLYEKSADGTGKTTPLLVDDANETNPSFSSDGRYLVFVRSAAPRVSHDEIWALPLFGGRKEFPVVQSQRPRRPLSPEPEIDPRRATDLARRCERRCGELPLAILSRVTLVLNRTRVFGEAVERNREASGIATSPAFRRFLLCGMGCVNVSRRIIQPKWQ
jgi:hypothetical protein